MYVGYESSPQLSVSYKVRKPNWFVASGTNAKGASFYSYGRLDDDRLFTYMMAWNDVSDPLVGGVQIMILNSFKKRNFTEAATRRRDTAGNQPLIATDGTAFERASQPQPLPPKLSATDIFKKVRRSVWVLLSFNPKLGKSEPDEVALGSAVAVGPTTLFTNCHTLKGHARHFITRAETDDAIPVAIARADYDGDRCVVQTQQNLPDFVHIKPYAAIDVGEEAYSIGTPEGYDLTMANGIVSGKRLRDGLRYLQTTASISHGSSGGGLFDSAGRLMGITTYYIADSQNLNFAIAADAF